MDSADAYDQHAAAFLRLRDRSTIGAEVVGAWAQSLTRGTEVIEIACGGGLPVTRVLADAGLRIWAIDASPTLLETFRGRFPDIPVQCARAQHSDFFDRKFAAAISIGLVFLLSAAEQQGLIHRVAEALLPGGRFLFTAPVEVGTWTDTVTGHACHSLGRDAYQRVFREAGLLPLGTRVDEGRNNYYEVTKTDS